MRSVPAPEPPSVQTPVAAGGLDETTADSSFRSARRSGGRPRPEVRLAWGDQPPVSPGEEFPYHRSSAARHPAGCARRLAPPCSPPPPGTIDYSGWVRFEHDSCELSSTTAARFDPRLGMKEEVA